VSRRHHVLFRRTNGLNTKVDPVRLEYDHDSGISELAAGLNIDIDDTGRIRTRAGQRLSQLTLPYHSLFCRDGQNLFGVTGTELHHIAPDLTSAVILRSGLTPGARMAFCQEDAASGGYTAFYANGHEKGRIVGGRDLPWAAGAYVGTATVRRYVDPPAGTKLALYNGRAYVAKGCVCWYSERFAYGWFHGSQYLPFATAARMIHPVDGGIFFGTEDKVYFYRGPQPEEFDVVVVADYPVVEWTDVSLPAKDIPLLEQPEGDALLVTTQEGICCGGAGGKWLNLTGARVDLPLAKNGAATCLDGRYIGLLEP
jgi:hypothetical protein